MAKKMRKVVQETSRGLNLAKGSMAFESMVSV
jgi:hypothetical protein